MSDNDWLPYYTILVPYVPAQFATEWHPTESTGSFSVLSRGAFKTVEAAIEWGQAKLGGTPYRIQLITE